MKKKTDAVFEGGGVKGIALVGAVSEIEKAGYEFQNLAGTSAGAIVSSLLAVGYTSKEMKEILEELNYNEFKDEGLLDKLGFIGKGLSIGFEYGIYEGDYFEDWFDDLLRYKKKVKFGDIKTDFPEEEYRYKVQVIAADITDRKLLVLPGDLKDLGYDPDEFSISRAVRMSMSIPVFFEPVKLQDASGRAHFIVDGGMLSNYPIWLLDDGSSSPPWPTFGFKLLEPEERAPNQVRGPISLFTALYSTMSEAHDARYIKDADFVRTIPIPTLDVKTTEFDLSPKKSEALYQSGRQAAEKFFNTWDFDKYVNKYRKGKPVLHRSSRLW